MTVPGPAQAKTARPVSRALFLWNDFARLGPSVYNCKQIGCTWDPSESVWVHRMATVKQSSIRFAAEDVVVLDEVQRRTGLVSTADALRFVIRQYAQQNGIEMGKTKPPKKPKR